MTESIKLKLNDWFTQPGASVLVDGQYGSTGKGLIAGALAECFYDRVGMVVSNAGPNSGHTSFLGKEEIILKQLPTFGVVAHKLAKRGGHAPLMYLSNGAVIDRVLLAKEIKRHNIANVVVGSNCAVIDKTMRQDDENNVLNIASTGQGVGPAIIRKLERRVGVTFRPMDRWPTTMRNYRDFVCFFEVSQGYSLGVNSGFYPHTTSRECTVMQALSDAAYPAQKLDKVIMSVRTFPIRVGDTVNSSGPYYPDQEELTWDQLGQKAEYTTVTKRQRRVFTWSDIQFADAVFANHPDVVFLNFCNYLNTTKEVDDFVKNRILPGYHRVTGRSPQAILLGFGPKSSDIRVWE